MSDAHLTVERRDAVFTITFNRPEKKNAMTGPMWDGLLAALAEARADRTVRVVVLTGSGDSFCAGQDLVDPVNAARFDGVGGALSAMRMMGGAALLLAELPQPTVAAVNGVAAGAGANLALGCDLIVAGESARFSQIFAKRGLTLDLGGSWLLPRLVGLPKAKELAFLGDMVSAAEAERIGLINRVVPDAALSDEVAALVTRLADGPPLALSAMKRQLNDSMQQSLAQALEAEAVAQSMLFSTDDVREAVTAFVEKRPPRFTGQ